LKGVSEANLFFVDASANKIGIGTNAPGALLHIKKSVSAGNVELYVENTSNTGSSLQVS
jgi:hypothetical protein